MLVILVRLRLLYVEHRKLHEPLAYFALIFYLRINLEVLKKDKEETLFLLILNLTIVSK